MWREAPPAVQGHACAAAPAAAHGRACRAPPAEAVSRSGASSCSGEECGGHGAIDGPEDGIEESGCRRRGRGPGGWRSRRGGPSPIAFHLALPLAVTALLLATTAADQHDNLQQDTLRPTRQAGVVVGDGGFICATFNGGFTWTEQMLERCPPWGCTVDLHDVFVLDDNSAVAVGGNCAGNYNAWSCGIFRRLPGVPVASGPMVMWSKMPLGVREGADSVKRCV